MGSLSRQSVPEHGSSRGHLATPRATGAFATLVIFVVLASAAVALRFYSRHISRGRYFAYDWMVLVALVRKSFGEGAKLMKN